MLIGDTWRESNGARCIVSIKGRVVKHHFVEGATEAEATAQRLSRAGADVFFAPARFDPAEVERLRATINPATGRHFTGRSQQAVATVGAFWVDLDCGPGTAYPKWLHGLLALIKWCKQAQFFRPSTIVRSGSGLHIYWLLDADYPLEAWQPVAQHLKQALALGGVKADPVRTADAASILRVPGTKNWKDRANPLPVAELFNDRRRLTLEEFQRRLPPVGPIRALSRPAREQDEWGVPDNHPAGDAEGIAEACAQMGHMRDTRGDRMPEPLWRAGLSILHRCDRAEYYIHEWSKGDERYNAGETERKAAGTGGPATCAYFAETNPEGCQGCPHAGKVTSPIQLALAGATPPGAEPAVPARPPAGDTERGEAASQDAGWRPTEVNNFKITDAGVYWQSPTTEGGAGELTRVTQVPLWVLEVREKAREDHEADSSSILLEWRGVDGRVRRAILRQAHVHDMRSFVSWLADHNLIAAVPEVKLLVNFISQYTLKLLKSRGAREFHERLGWHRDGFVVGNRTLTREGAREALVQSTSPIARITPQGDVEQWKEAIKPLGEKGRERYAFALLCGFASPILPLAEVQSAVVSLAGVSGAGKTLAARAALSIFGQPQYLMQGATASQNSIEVQLSVQRHVPYLWDEVTHVRVQRLTDFIYLAANGQGKSSLTQTREMREAGSWQLVPMVTTNQPLLEVHQRYVQEAHRRRLLELYFPTALPYDVGAHVDAGIEANAGSAAEPFFRALCAVREEIPAMFARVQEWLRGQTQLPDANRFALWTLTAAVVGGTVARAAGLIDFDPQAVVLEVLKEVEAGAQHTEEDPQRAQEAVKEWLAQESKRICRWRDGTRGAGAVGELVDDPIARDYGNGRVAIHKRFFYEMLQEERISRHALNEWFAAAELEEKTVRLAPGTPGVWSLIVNAEAVGLADEEDA